MDTHRKKLIDKWSSIYGEQISEEEYLEMGRTLRNFFEILHRWYKEGEQKKAQSKPQTKVEPRIETGLPSEENKLVNVEQLAKILDVPKSWIYSRTYQGQESIPHIKLGKYLRFDPSEVIEFFKKKGSNGRKRA